MTRLIRIQLAIFTIVSVVVVGTISMFYLHLPTMLGLGTYRVTADFVATGGLYQNANVTFRGVTVGRVEAVDLTHDGIAARMRLASDISVPANVTATVKSVSAVGEQYLDLVPPTDPSPQRLHNGSRIDRAQTRIGQDVAGLLREAEKLVSSVDESRLQDLLRETFTAFDGSGPDLARLITSSRQLVDAANTDWPQIAQLIDQAGPFLDAQIRSGEDIQLLADGLARFTGDVRQADTQVHSLLATAPTAADEAATTFAGIRPTFPLLAANLANLGRVGVIYHKSIEQTLVLMPAVFAMVLTIAGALPPDEGAKADFKIDLGDPPPCETGFIPPPLIRTPADETLRSLPPDLYCKTAPDDPSAVRGARNYPCQEFPGKRAPTIQLCRDPAGYVPLGTNPWRGPPVPYGTPVTDPRNILPPNKFPYTPPNAEPDPGTPVPPPPPPPDTPAPAAPLPAEAPTGSVPQASSPPVATVDPSTGTFVDPAGGSGVYAPGANQSAAENWADLMLDPRPA
jgi:phospholipid/cholesterol/gamma-HCH transport system substrate-binding protein